MTLQTREPVVERVGECLDGDHCPRYHCRTCNRWWIGNEEHRCGEEPGYGGTDSTPRQLEARVIRWMEAELAKIDDVETCAWTVLEHARRAALGDALLDLFGDRIILDIWREHQVDQAAPPPYSAQRARGRRGANAPAAKPPADLEPSAAGGNAPAETDARVRGSPIPAESYTDEVSRRPRAVQESFPERGLPLVDVDQLAREDAALEALVRVDGEWIRLGDLDGHQCRILQVKHDQAARAFGRLADELADGETVRQRWTGEQLRELFGDTLDAAASGRPGKI